MRYVTVAPVGVAMTRNEILEKLFRYMVEQKVRMFFDEMDDHAREAGIDPTELRALVNPLLVEQLSK